MPASGVFCLDLLPFALRLRAITSHVAHFATQVIFTTKPFSSSSSRSTQFHGRIPTISTWTTMVFTAVLWTRRHMVQLSLPGPREPHSAVSAVSKRHGMTHIAWVPQHHMSLHVLLQSTQVCQQQIMGAHYITYFQHNSPELLIVPSDRGPLPQVKQMGLVAQGMVQITELSFQCVAKILPRTHTQSCPILVSH